MTFRQPAVEYRGKQARDANEPGGGLAAADGLPSPSIHHRLRFRLRPKAYLVETGHRLLIIGALFLGVGLTAILVLISTFGSAAAGIVGCGVATLWFAVPLAPRGSLPTLMGGPAQA